MHVLQKNNGLSEDLESSRSALYDKGTVKFTIRWRCLYDDVMKKDETFFQVKPLCKVVVEITSVNTEEAGIDTGGLGRETTTLLYNSFPGRLVQGMENEYSFIHDLYKIEDLFCFGQFVALAILHGYEAPHFLNVGLSSHILGKFTDSFYNWLFKFDNKNLHISILQFIMFMWLEKYTIFTMVMKIPFYAHCLNSSWR